MSNSARDNVVVHRAICPNRRIPSALPRSVDKAFRRFCFLLFLWAFVVRFF